MTTIDLQKTLGLRRSPVAIRFQDAPSDGTRALEKTEASGCSYWRLAGNGKSFFTEPKDHHGCPVGAHTHGIDLPPEKSEELNQLIGTMVGLNYLSTEEVEGLPQRPGPFQGAQYEPLSNDTPTADVILFCGNAKQMMLVAEAAHAAGIESDFSLAGRPTCAAIPAVVQTGKAFTNLGCIGNRVYTELLDNEFYLALPGKALGALLDSFETVHKANEALESFHQERAAGN